MTFRYLLLLALLLPPVAQAQDFDPRPLATSPLVGAADFSHDRLDDFFEVVDYLGAFAPGADRWDAGWTNYDPQNTDYGDPAQAVVLSGNITQDRTLTADNTYFLEGFVNVMEGATLTIEPGTVIFGDFETKGSLIVNRGAKIMAEGTAEAPIVFTSERPAGQRAGGDWGGVIIAGRASINSEGGEAVLEGGTGTVYGGGASPNDDDDSGVFRYVRLEFPGIEFAPDNEINGLTMGGVGRGTTIEYVQVSFCDDDSFEWFGGTVDGRYLVSFAALDDDFDGDIGWRGRVQFGLIIRDPDLGDISGSNAFEQDNAPSEPAGGTAAQPGPRSAPVFSNVTVLGPLLYASQAEINPNYRRGAHIRRASRASIYNSVILGFPEGVRVDGLSIREDIAADLLQIRNTFVQGPIVSNQEGFDAAAWFTSAAHGNVQVTDVAALQIPAATAPFVSNEDAAPAPSLSFSLAAVYPNPVAGRLQLEYAVETAQRVRLAVYDLLGREVAVVAEGVAPAGPHAASLDAAALPSGVYLVRLQGEQGSLTRRVTVVR